jgi:hypothetical protein
LFAPLDIIPDRIAYFGHVDEFAFVLSGLIAARLLAPPSSIDLAPTDLRGALLAPIRARARYEFAQKARFTIRVVRADLANFFLFQYRGVHAFLITGKNSGTHWLKFMLSCAIAEQFGVPHPTHASGRTADAIIGHPRWAPAYPQLPRIGSSHTIPSIAFAWQMCFLAHPPVVVLVRDIREAMLSNYVKWRQQYGGSFTEYVQGDPMGRRHVADVWWYIHFFNRWGDIACANPQNILVVRYEDLKSSPEYWLRHIAAHVKVPLSNRAYDVALQFVGRTAMRTRLDPSHQETIIPSEAARDSIRFSDADEKILQDILRRNLRHDFGYGYPVRGTSRVADEPDSTGWVIPEI